METEFESGSFVVPTDEGNYACPPAKVIETFWAFKRKPDGTVIYDRNDMRLMYKWLDHLTFEELDPEAYEMTPELWAKIVSTRDHPHFI